jgi:hypothetical protein
LSTREAPNTTRLAIDLFCHGARIDPSALAAGAERSLRRTRAGLGSGLEVVLPGRRKDQWINVPVDEAFAAASPYSLVGTDSGLALRDSRDGVAHPVTLPEDPEWYDERTSRGLLMADVGVMQGTYLGVYVGPVCGFWAGRGDGACHFCTTGRNVGENEAAEKTVEDVVETALAAKRESGITFVHLNAGYRGESTLDGVEPYVRALKEKVGVLVGVQATPARDLSRYDRLRELGVDHVSFCYEFHDTEVFEQYCPGKAKALGQDTYFRAIEYCARLFGRGACSGEIIAGVEPLETTLKAIDWIASVGAFPTVCVFRPTIGSKMESHPSPAPADMEVALREVWEACRRHLVPLGLAPNIEVSLIVNPLDTRELVEHPGIGDRAWRAALAVGRVALRPVFERRMRPRAP